MAPGWLWLGTACLSPSSTASSEGTSEKELPCEAQGSCHLTSDLPYLEPRTRLRPCPASQKMLEMSWRGWKAEADVQLSL